MKKQLLSVDTITCCSKTRSWKFEANANADVLENANVKYEYHHLLALTHPWNFHANADFTYEEGFKLRQDHLVYVSES